MRKILFLLTIAHVVHAGLSAQNQQPCDALNNNSGDVVHWSSKDAEKFTKNYFKKFKDGVHTRAVYFNSLAFEFISDFFEANYKYTGLEIWFVIDKYNTRSTNPDSGQIDIVFVPVIKMGEPDFDAFEKFRSSSTKWRGYKQKDIDQTVLCPGTCDISYLQSVGVPYGTNDTLCTVPQYRFHDVLFSSRVTIERDADKYREFKNNQVKRHKRKRYTQSVFFEAGKFNKIGKFLKDPGYGRAQFPVYALYWIDYRKKCKKPRIEGQIRRNQSAVGFSPVKADKHCVYPDPCSYRRFLDELMKNSSDPDTGGADNHGTLCPTGCPPGGN